MQASASISAHLSIMGMLMGSVECNIVKMSIDKAEKLTLSHCYQDYLCNLLSPFEVRATVRVPLVTTSSFQIRSVI